MTQQAVVDVRRLTRQRTRWAQGNLQCARYLRRLVTSRQLRVTSVLEVLHYLISPWINAVVTVSLKGITNTQRPSTEFENGHYGFPSYHSSSTFTIAAVVDEYYGWPAGLP